jgi:hypothetical protein
MTAEHWRDLAVLAVRRYETGDPELLDLLARLLEEQEQARYELREIGFGCIGRPWLGIVADIRETMGERT